jgi:hypothetical protein
VQDLTGKVVYEIAGRWNSQLVARAVGTSTSINFLLTSCKKKLDTSIDTKDASKSSGLTAGEGLRQACSLRPQYFDSPKEEICTSEG